MVPKAKQNLHECLFHLEGMKKIKNIEELEICFAAFVNSARNVTFVLQKEYRNNEKFTKWYKNKQSEMLNNSLCKYFKELRNKIDKEGINELNFATTIKSINTSTDLINKPNNSSVILTPKGIYYQINKGTSKEDIVPASHKGFIQTQVFVNNLPADSNDKNIFDLCIIHYSFLKNIVEEWTGILNQQENI
jgi:hypothetical protein